MYDQIKHLKILFQLDFPAVTLCNHNRIDCKYLKHLMSQINESNTYDDHDYLILFEELFNVGCSDNAQTITSPEQEPSTILP